jgi:hypothetical protein
MLCEGCSHKYVSTQLRASAAAAAGYEWASAAWKDATWVKVPAVQQLLRLGYNVLLSDIDVMWLADPLPYLTAMPSEVGCWCCCETAIAEWLAQHRVLLPYIWCILTGCGSSTKFEALLCSWLVMLK